MTNQLHYKDYIGSVFFSEEDEVFHGRIIGISDSVSFEGDSVQALKADFYNAVDEYLEFCTINNKQPQKNNFSIQLSPEVYNNAILHATQKGLPLNIFVEEVIRTNLFA